MSATDGLFFPSYSGEEHVHRPLQGSIALMIYMVVWICSLASPVIVLGLLWWKAYYSCAVVMMLILSAYTPLWGRIKAFRTFMGSGAERYFKASSLRYEAGVDLSGKTPTIICVHPHGIFPLGWGLLTTRPELEDFRFCFSSVLYMSPFFRIFTLLIGRPASADKQTFLKLMRQKKNLALIPGGFEEATLTSSSADRVFIKDRRGFVKYALQNGYALSPAYSFGENKCFENVQGAWKFRLWLNSFGLPAIVPYRRSTLPFLPNDSQLHVVVGAPLQLPIIESPTPEQVKEYHGKYVETLKALFDRHKKNYGVTGDLEVW